MLQFLAFLKLTVCSFKFYQKKKRLFPQVFRHERSDRVVQGGGEKINNRKKEKFKRKVRPNREQITMCLALFVRTVSL